MTSAFRYTLLVSVLAFVIACPHPLLAQIGPNKFELSAYTGLHAAAAKGDVEVIEQLIRSGADKEARDDNARTPLHVAVFQKQGAAVAALMRLGADANALDAQRYDAVTIAAVANDVATMTIALAGGNRPDNITSPYDGTALIASAHLGHVEVVRALIAAGAPLNHVNNLGWTALIEAIILGNGGTNHTVIVEMLVKAGADVSLADRDGRTPLALARGRGYAKIVRILEAASAR
jgi:ankyrin repeat protein